jgi:hypothetical protein
MSAGIMAGDMRLENSGAPVCPPIVCMIRINYGSGWCVVFRSECDSGLFDELYLLKKQLDMLAVQREMEDFWKSVRSFTQDEVDGRILCKSHADDQIACPIYAAYLFKKAAVVFPEIIEAVRRNKLELFYGDEAQAILENYLLDFPLDTTFIEGYDLRYHGMGFFFPNRKLRSCTLAYALYDIFSELGRYDRKDMSFVMDWSEEKKKKHLHGGTEDPNLLIMLALLMDELQVQIRKDFSVEIAERINKSEDVELGPRFRKL